MQVVIETNGFEEAKQLANVLINTTSYIVTLASPRSNQYNVIIKEDKK